MKPMEYALQGTRRGVIAGLVLGTLYSVGGLFIDLTTTGLNAGTALAFLALIGMPLIFGAIGAVTGLFIGWLKA